MSGPCIGASVRPPLDETKQMYIELYHFCYDMKRMLTDDDVDNVLDNLLVLFLKVPKATRHT